MLWGGNVKFIVPSPSVEPFAGGERVTAGAESIVKFLVSEMLLNPELSMQLTCQLCVPALNPETDWDFVALLVAAMPETFTWLLTVRLQFNAGSRLSFTVKLNGIVVT